MKELTIAYSPCPNDTYIFHALTHGLIESPGLRFKTFLADIEELNRLAFSGIYDITKLSAFAYLKLRKKYTLIRSGSAIGFGCGPILIKGKTGAPLQKMRIAVPGINTTAALLLRLWNPGLAEFIPTRFDLIIPLVARGEFDAGLVIHEGRFIIEDLNLTKVVDLGEWWESYTGLPIPLGVIAVNSDRFNSEESEAIGRYVRLSIEHANTRPGDSEEYIKSNSQEMNPEVIKEHIALYVNDFSIDLGEAGLKSLKTLESEAVKKGLL